MRAIRNIIFAIIDFFHTPFERFIDRTTFRYLACGGSNQVLDILIFFLSYNFLFQKDDVHLFGFVVAPYTAALALAFCISFPMGFLLSKFIVFEQSNLKGRVQFFRYALLVGTCIVLNYVFLKLFVEVFHLYPTPAKILTTAIVAVFSYVSQRKFTFKVKPDGKAKEGTAPSSSLIKTEKATLQDV